ncbi:HK97 family phage major capsid protein [Peptoniphilus olsenii]|uniref:HK97 family phage major capsid protein n=1 Tax=Peptoniphilus olsenii TaxID=411570 RepID=A0ABV2J7J1_9FIRM
MLKSVNIKNKIEKIKNEMKELQAQGKIDEAHEKIELLNQARKELDLALEEEKEEFSNIVENATEIDNAKDIDVNKVFNKLIMGKPVTEKEYEVYNVGTPGQVEHTDEKGGYLVPEEQANTIKEFRRHKIALKDYCNIVEVNTLSGKFPVAKDQKGTLTNFEELTEIGQSEITFAQQNWEVKDYGDIIPVSNTLLEDTNLPLISVIGNNFTQKAVNTENAEILKLLKTAKIKVTGKDYKDIITALNVKLDPAIANNAVIITNQSGFDYLDKLEDENKRPLLTIDLTDTTKKLFKGKKVLVLTDEMLPLDAKKYPFYVGDIAEFVNFYDRKGVEIARSTEAGFTKNATLLRVIERFDAKTVDTEAMAYVTISEATATEA